MKDQHTLASGLIRLGIQRLAKKYPFHARVLERLKWCRRDDLLTMAVTISGDTVQLLYAPDFVTKISMDELGGVLLHEVNHVVFGHLVVDPSNYPDQWARTVAEEITVNEFVNEPLPGEPIRLKQFPQFPEMESTNQRYLRLQQHTNRRAISPSPLKDMEELAQMSGEEPGSLMTVDDHSVWAEALQDLERSHAALRAIVHDAVIDLGTDNVPEEFHDAIHRMGIGHLAGNYETLLNGGHRGEIEWRQLLRRFVGRHVSIQPDFRYPPRRFPHLVGIVPGRRRRHGRPHVLAVIDTSASMSVELLELVNGELSRLASQYRVTVVECDAEIQAVYPYRKIHSVIGRGGTDLCPPFEPSFLRVHRPDLVIYFTDGYGPAPSDRPTIPVLWCLTPNGQTPADWGEVVQMNSDGTSAT